MSAAANRTALLWLNEQASQKQGWPSLLASIGSVTLTIAVLDGRIDRFQDDVG
jgi:hypothetical protein